MQNRVLHDGPVDVDSGSESICIVVANSVFTWIFVEWILLTELHFMLCPVATGLSRDRKPNDFDISEEL
jgi:hypothetical protein